MSLHLFSFSDPIPSHHRSLLPTYFHVTTSTTYDVLLLRLLTSVLKIENTKSGKIIIIRNNYSAFPFHLLLRKSAKPIKQLIYPHTLSDYEKFSKKYYSRNINFYHNVLQEFVFYHYYINESQFVTAFVNLYRILEYLSYSIPLMHSSHFGNYLGSFNALKSYFNDEKTSEIAFLEKFVDKLFRGTSYLGLTTIFDFSNSDITIANNCYSSFFALMKSTDWISAVPSTHKLEIENSKLISLFKNTRNRYFHFAVGGQRNIHTTDLADPDFFFSRVHTPFVNWISFLLSYVIKENLTNAYI